MNFLIAQIANYAPFALGAYLSISVMRIPNLAIESAVAVGAIAGALMASLLPALGITGIWSAAFLAGGCTGLVAALLHTKGYISHLLAGLITIGLFHGIMQFLAPTGQVLFGQNLLASHSREIYIAIASMFLVGLIHMLLQTQLGLACGIYGNNVNFLRHFKISTNWIVCAGLFISNGLAGLSGAFIAQANGFADALMGSGIILLGLTILVLGRIHTFGKHVQITIPMLGAATYFSLQYILLKIGFDLRYFTAVQAAIIACILLMNNYSSNKQEPDMDLGV